MSGGPFSETTRDRREQGLTYGGHALGLDLRAGFDIPGVLERSPPSMTTSGRRVVLSLLDEPQDARRWPDAGAERTFEFKRPSEPPFFTIDHHPEVGYRVWNEGLGSCTIDVDGTQIACVATDGGPSRWGLVLGQGLPIAAALQGLEVLHASAVALGGRVFAFSAPSGTGKTALAVNLLIRGAEFVADDVVAVEVKAGRLIAQPGLSVAHLHPTERAALAGTGLTESPTEPDGKQYVALPRRAAAAPLAAFYFLSARKNTSRIEILRQDPPDARVLLGATFVAHVSRATRLITQLEICSRLASTVPIFDVAVPTSSDAGDVADHVFRHVGDLP